MAMFFTYLLPLLLPAAIYLLWRVIARRRPAATDDGSADSSAESRDDLWREAPWLWLAIAGMALLVVVLLFGAFVHGSPQRGQYLPPRMENGQIVPGELRSPDSGTERSGNSTGPAR